MKVTCFSDIHGQISKGLTKWFKDNPGDLLIFAGDLQLNQINDYGEKFMNWFHKLPYTIKIMTFGNHDGHYQNVIEYKIDKKMDDIIILTNTTVTVHNEKENIKIYGSPHSVQYGRWWFMMRDEELEHLWKEIPDDIDILITHGPPLGILDNTCDNFTTGSKTLLERVKQLKNLKYHIFGHIHESHGIEVIDKTTFMNVSLLDEKYRLINKPISFDYFSGITEEDYNVGE